MITLYGMSSPNVIKVFLMLEEIGEPYRFERCDVIHNEQFDPRFLALNPNAKVPVIVDDSPAEGPLTIFESGAILFYLAEKAGQLLPPPGPDRYHVMQWVMFQMAGVGPMFGQAIHFRDRPSGNAYAETRYKRELERLCGVIEGELANRPFIAGQAYSIADVALFPWMRTCTRYFPDVEFGPATRRWFDETALRPATVRTLEVVAALASMDANSMKSASPEQIIRYYGSLRD